MENEINKDEEKIDFLKFHQDTLVFTGFWKEEYKSSVIRAIESRYRAQVIREWRISDFVIHADQILCKWGKRFSPLSDEDLMEQYGIPHTQSQAKQ